MRVKVLSLVVMISLISAGFVFALNSSAQKSAGYSLSGTDIALLEETQKRWEGWSGKPLDFLKALEAGGKLKRLEEIANACREFYYNYPVYVRAGVWDPGLERLKHVVESLEPYENLLELLFNVRPGGPLSLLDKQYLDELKQRWEAWKGDVGEFLDTVGEEYSVDRRPVGRLSALMRETETCSGIVRDWREKLSEKLYGEDPSGVIHLIPYTDWKPAIRLLKEIGDNVWAIPNYGLYFGIKNGFPPENMNKILMSYCSQYGGIPWSIVIKENIHWQPGFTLLTLDELEERMRAEEARLMEYEQRLQEMEAEYPPPEEVIRARLFLEEISPYSSMFQELFPWYD